MGVSWAARGGGFHGGEVWTPSPLGITFQGHLMTFPADALGKWVNPIVATETQEFERQNFL